MDYLLVSVGGCLMNSFAFCLQKKRIPAELSLKVEGVLDRDEKKALRVKGINCLIQVEVEGRFHHRVEGCYRIFKKYCVVSASVGQGIPIETTLRIYEKL